MFKWFFALVNLGFAAWLISAFTDTETCAGLTGAELEGCEAGTAIGGFAAAAMILFLWLAVDVILYVGYRIFRRKDHGPKRAKVEL